MELSRRHEAPLGAWSYPIVQRVALGLSLVLLVVGCRTESHEPDAVDQASRPIAVTYFEAELQSVEDAEEAIATVRPKHAPRIAVEVDGTIEQIMADEGDRVEQGQRLAALAREDFEISYRRAEADIRRLKVLIEQKERELTRRERLREGGHTPEALIEELGSEHAVLLEELAAAQTEHERARRDLDRTSIHAPYEGMIASRRASEGDYVEAGATLFEMTANSLLQVRIPLPEVLAERLRPGLEVRLTTAAGPHSAHVGWLEQISPQVDNATRAITAIAEVDNPGTWRAGISLNAEIILERRDSVVVPPESVVRRPAGQVVYIAVYNLARERPVVTGRRTADGIEILEGVEPGDRVIVDGAGFMSDGAMIEAIAHGTELVSAPGFDASEN